MKADFTATERMGAGGIAYRHIVGMHHAGPTACAKRAPRSRLAEKAIQPVTGRVRQHQRVRFIFGTQNRHDRPEDSSRTGALQGDTSLHTCAGSPTEPSERPRLQAADMRDATLDKGVMRTGIDSDAIDAEINPPGHRKHPNTAAMRPIPQPAGVEPENDEISRSRGCPTK